MENVGNMYNVRPIMNDNFQHDIQEIIHFPQNQNAQLKVVDNQLSRTDESYLSWAKGWSKGTQLKGTVDYISSKVVNQSVEIFNRHISDFESDFKEKNFTKIESEINNLENDITRNVKLLEGLEKINMVYEERYIDDLNNPGLERLRTLNKFLKNQIQTELNDYKKIMEKLSAELGEEKSSISDEKQTRSENPNISPNSNLEAFCYTYNREVTPEEAKIWIKKGEVLLQDIFAGTRTQMRQDPAEAEIETAALTWVLMNVAIKKGDGFQQGTFVLNDPTNRIHSFLKTHPKHYTRASSHYAGRAPKVQEGIDVFNQPMPAGKRTILFSEVDQMDGSKVLFFKPEDYSADHKHLFDFTMHGYEFLAAQKNKILYPGSDDLPNMRKERVPVEILSEFKNVLAIFDEFKKEHGNLFKDPIFQRENPEKDAKLYGVAFMKPYVEALQKLDIYPAEFNPSAFYKTLEGMDHLDKRTGREAFIDISELLNLNTKTLKEKG